ncbi:MAG: hypothetical protein JWR69_4525 [Pedosphaera sp.]|nr:hypothetical protein [Pedosphaera sp.]
MDSILIFVRQKKSLRLLNNAGEWGGNFSEARTFPTTWAALNVCMKQDLHEAEIVMRCGSPAYDVLFDVA